MINHPLTSLEQEYRPYWGWGFLILAGIAACWGVIKKGNPSTFLNPSRYPELKENKNLEIFRWVYKSSATLLKLKKQNKIGDNQGVDKIFTINQSDLNYGTLIGSPIKLKITLIASIPKFNESMGEYIATTNEIYLKMSPNCQYIDENNKNDVLSYIEDIGTALYHELIHFFQYNTKEKIGLDRDLEEQKEMSHIPSEFYVVAEEFKPYSSALVPLFISSIRQKIQEQELTIISQELRNFIKNNFFLTTLKKVNLTKWKQAIKDLTIELNRNKEFLTFIEKGKIIL